MRDEGDRNEPTAFSFKGHRIALLPRTLSFSLSPALTATGRLGLAGEGRGRVRTYPVPPPARNRSGGAASILPLLAVPSEHQHFVSTFHACDCSLRASQFLRRLTDWSGYSLVTVYMHVLCC